MVKGGWMWMRGKGKGKGKGGRGGCRRGRWRGGRVGFVGGIVGI